MHMQLLIRWLFSKVKRLLRQDFIPLQVHAHNALGEEKMNLRLTYQILLVILE